MWGFFFLNFVFRCVPQVLNVFSIASHFFLFHVVCQRRGITSSYRNFYFGEFPKFQFFFLFLNGWANQNGSVLLKLF